MGRQADALHRWLAAWPDDGVAEQIAYLGVSAFRGGNQHRNKGLGRCLAAAEAGRIPAGSVLLVEDHRRFSRREPVDALKSVITQFWGAGLGFAVCNYDGGRPLFKADARAQHLALLAFLFEQAHPESSEKSRWATAARATERERQDSGERTDGRAPWWIARDPETGRLLRDAAGGLVADPEHCRAIHRAVELAIGGLGQVLIAERLAEEGFSPPPTGWARNNHPDRTESKWTPGVVSRFLRSPALVGTLQRLDAELPGYYPRLLSDEEHARLRALIEQRDRTRGRIRGLSHQCRNLFQGVARCSECGGPVSFTAPAKRARAGHPGYVSCPASRRGVGRCVNTGYVAYDAFESHCLTRLAMASWESLLHRHEDDADQHQLEQRIISLQSERDRLQEQLRAAQKRAEEAWLASASEERQATIERAIGRLRADHALAGEQLIKAEKELAVIRSKPSAADASAEMLARVRDFWSSHSTATPAERLSFNRWLLARLEFRVHPLPAGAEKADRPIELLVGGVSAGIPPLAPAARHAPGAPVADPAAGGVGPGSSQGMRGSWTRPRRSRWRRTRERWWWCCLNRRGRPRVEALAHPPAASESVAASNSGPSGTTPSWPCCTSCRPGGWGCSGLQTAGWGASGQMGKGFCR